MSRKESLKRDLEETRRKLIQFSNEVPKETIGTYPTVIQRLINEEYQRLESKIIHLQEEIKANDLLAKME